MYTVHMSWSFRSLVLIVAMAWGVAPQIACFMPDQTLSQQEKDCCKEIASDCAGSNMSHECCRTVVRTDVGIAAKAIRHVLPDSHLPNITTDIVRPMPLDGSRQLATRNNYAPPHDRKALSSILRI